MEETTRRGVLVAGAGLAGLALADALHRAGVPVRVLEARSRAGGRIWSEGGFDLGPTWFWPGQRRMASLVDELGLERFEQPTRGTALLERGGQRHRLPPQQEMVSYRVAGGMGALAEGLLARLPKEALLLGRRVQRVRLEGTSVRVEAAGPEGVEVYAADAVALTLPPRLLAELAIEPALPRAQLAELRAVPTWMAGTAKAVAVYDTPFWRERGFSGTAFSADGPLQEIHDATSPGGPAALFGFVGGTTAERGSVGAEALTRAIGEQLARLFGPPPSAPAITLAEWGDEPFTTSAADAVPLRHHPRYGLSRTRYAEGRLVLAGTETSDELGGYLEGALASAERAFRELDSVSRSAQSALASKSPSWPG